MIEQVEQVFKDVISSLQIAKLYTTTHALFGKSVDKAFLSLQSAFKEQDNIVIGIVGEELAFQKEILFDLSKATRPFITYLKNRGIEKITFNRPATRQELEIFIAFVATSQEGQGNDAESLLSLRGVRNIHVGKITASAAPEARTLQGNIYQDSLEKASESVQSILDEKVFDYLALRFSLHNALEGIASHYKEMLTLTAVRRYDANTYMHSLNVSLLAMYFSTRLGFARDDVLDIGTAGLFHDVGKLYIASTILKKSGKLTEEEFGIVKSHTLLGSQILARYVDEIGILPLVVSFEHHLRYDLKGYPKSRFMRPLHTASLIVAICDVYDALFQRRSYKNDYPPVQVYEIMRKEEGGLFEPKLLARFFEVMGVWPIGTLVVLNDGRVAVVKEENEDSIFLPKVEVVQPADKKEFIDLKVVSERIKIERFLNPWKEGKEILSLISEGA